MRAQDDLEPVVLSVGEALYLHRLGVADAATILRLLVETTSRAIFPGRRIGTLEPGGEASFLALAGDPLADLGRLRAICVAVKLGQGLAIEPATGCP